MSLQIIFFLCILNISAQDTDTTPIPGLDATRTDIVNAYLSPANESPLIGEPVAVEIIVEAPAGSSILEWVMFPEDDVYTIIDEGGQETTDASGEVIFRQNVTLVLWQTGQYLTPQMTVAVSVPGESSTVFPVQSATFTVPSVLVDVIDPTIRPAIAPVDLPYISPLWIAAGVLAFSLIIVLLYRALRRRGGRIDGVAAGSAAQVTIADFEDLKAQLLSAQDTYPIIADRLRQFLRQDYGIDAVEMTTVELIRLLKNQRTLPDDLIKQLKRILEQADLVKFAQFAPDEADKTRLINIAIRWVQSAAIAKLDSERTG
ncbi:MAG: hypothetical protein ACPG7F_14380 [Aggregatilineales bacterium]